MKVLIDTNIVLDFLLQREPFFQDAELLFQKIDSGHVVRYVTATTLTDIFYISRRHTRSIDQARQAVSEMLTAMIICPVNRAVLESAFGSGLADFEDAIQIACAIAQRLDAILTRDTQGFLSSSLPVFINS
ncbi:DNA-binding protein [Nostoc cf. commune SO-36]|uniref:DNA-binding protein n=1 Tax=Nostoc cf. commune SO-36 TaxID=449208 RepID=A0ABM7Z898_NOSCO|nr:PIN domain-containing protein [Nostoc commune]BDI19393.1 DNA-binding protein [Nostoc cf. commune SO-36]